MIFIKKNNYAQHLQSYAESQPSLDEQVLSYEPYGFFFRIKVQINFPLSVDRTTLK